MNVAEFYEKTSSTVSDTGQRWALFCLGVHLSKAEEAYSTSDSGLVPDVIGIFKTFELEFSVTECKFLSAFLLYPSRIDFEIEETSLPSEELIHGFYRVVFGRSLPLMPRSLALWIEAATSPPLPFTSYETAMEVLSELSAKLPILKQFLKNIVSAGLTAPVYCIGAKMFHSLTESYVKNGGNTAMCLKLVRCGYELARQFVSIRPETTAAVRDTLTVFIRSARKLLESPSDETKEAFLASIPAISAIAENTYTFTDCNSYETGNVHMPAESKFGIAQSVGDDSYIRLGPVVDHEMAVFAWRVDSILSPKDARGAPYSLISLLFYITTDRKLVKTPLGAAITKTREIWRPFLKDLKQPGAKSVKFDEQTLTSVRCLSYTLMSAAVSPLVGPLIKQAIVVFSDATPRVTTETARGKFVDHTSKSGRFVGQNLPTPKRQGIETGQNLDWIEFDEQTMIILGAIIPVFIILSHKCPPKWWAVLLHIFVVLALFLTDPGIRNLIDVGADLRNMILMQKMTKALFTTDKGSTENIAKYILGAYRFVHGPVAIGLTISMFSMVLNISNWNFAGKKRIDSRRSLPFGSQASGFARFLDKPSSYQDNGHTVSGLTVNNEKAIVGTTKAFIAQITGAAAEERADSSNENAYVDGLLVLASTAVGAPIKAFKLITGNPLAMGAIVAGTTVFTSVAGGWWDNLTKVQNLHAEAKSNEEFLMRDAQSEVAFQNAAIFLAEFSKFLPFIAESLIIALESSRFISAETSVTVRRGLLEFSRLMPWVSNLMGAYALYTNGINISVVGQSFHSDRKAGTGVSKFGALEKAGFDTCFAYFDPEYGVVPYCPSGNPVLAVLPQFFLTPGLTAIAYYFCSIGLPFGKANLGEVMEELDDESREEIKFEFLKKVTKVALSAISYKKDSEIGLVRRFFRKLLSEKKVSQEVKERFLGAEEDICENLLALYDFEAIADVFLGSQTVCPPRLLNSDDMVYIFDSKDLLDKDDSSGSVKSKASLAPYSVQLRLFSSDDDGSGNPKVLRIYIFRMFHLLNLVANGYTGTRSALVAEVEERRVRPDVPTSIKKQTAFEASIVRFATESAATLFVQRPNLKIQPVGPIHEDIGETKSSISIYANIEDKSFARGTVLTGPLRFAQFFTFAAARAVRLAEGGDFFSSVTPKVKFATLDYDYIHVTSAYATPKNFPLLMYISLNVISEILEIANRSITKSST